jgi:hypothetical protein
MPRIYVIHENDAWVEPLRAAFDESRLPFTEWFIDDGTLDLGETPPYGVFYNRMSASSHTRGHRYAAELTGGVLAWLESYDRRVVNGGRALQLEISKMAQYTALARYGIRVPQTVAAVGRDAIVLAARTMPGRFITKHNRAGKGLGVRLFDSVDALERYVDSAAFEPSVDGVTLIQQYIDAPKSHSSRASNSSAASCFTPSGSTRRSASSCARRTRARSATSRVRLAKPSQPPRRRGFASSTASRIRSSTGTAVSWSTTTSASPASSSSPIAAARFIRMTSIRTRTTTRTPSATPALRHEGDRRASATSCARSIGAGCPTRAADAAGPSTPPTGAGGRPVPPTEDNGGFAQERTMANAREVVIVNGARTAIGVTADR